MPFTFYSRKTKEEIIKQQLINGESLHKWWLQYSNSFNWLNFKSHYTRQMDNAIERFQQRIDTITAEQQQKRLDALHQLYDHVLNWLSEHSKQHMNSSRCYQISELRNWLETQLCGDSSENQCDKIKQAQQQHAEWHLARKTAFDSKNYIPNKGVKSIQDDCELHKWWKSASQLRFYQYRSKATKQLDQAIKWYCTSFIIDKIESLDEILTAINCWKAERSEVSDRLDAVLLLEQQIKVNI